MKLKKLLSGLTAAVMALSALAIAPMTGGAADTDYANKYGEDAIVLEGEWYRYTIWSADPWSSDYSSADCNLETVYGDGVYEDGSGWNFTISDLNLTTMTAPTVFIQGTCKDGVTAKIGVQNATGTVYLADTDVSGKYFAESFTLDTACIQSPVLMICPDNDSLDTKISKVVIYDAAKKTVANGFDYAYELGIVINRAYGLNEDKYTPESYETFMDIVNGYLELLDSAYVDDSEYLDAINAINAAFKDLRYDATTYLEMAIEEANTYSPKYYTADSWVDFEEALKDAIDLDENASDEKKLAAADALYDAIDALVLNEAEYGQAMLMFRDSNHLWLNGDFQNTIGGYGNDAFIENDGTYSVSITADSITGDISQDADGVYSCENPQVSLDEETGKIAAGAEGAIVFCIDINGLLAEDAYSEDELSAEILSIKCDDKELAFDTNAVLSGDIEDTNDNYRIEIYNEYGDTGTDGPAPIDPYDIEFGESLEVSFRIVGLGEDEDTKAELLDELKALVADFDKIDSSKYTAASYAAAKAAADAAKALITTADLDLELVTGLELMNAKKALSSAIGALTTPRPSTTATTAKKITTTKKVVPPTVAKVKKLKAKSAKKKTLKVTWKKVKGAKGYTVQVAAKKTFKKLAFKKTINKNAKKLTVKGKKIKSGKKYFVRVKAYKTYKDANGKTQTAWGKWVKTKKAVKVK